MWSVCHRSAQVYRAKIRKAKAQCGLKVAGSFEDNNKSLCNCISSKGKSTEKVDPLLSSEGTILTDDAEET